MSMLKVSSHSSPNSVAGAIANVVRQTGVAEMQVIGAGALNQAMKAVAIARTFLAGQVDLVCAPSFTEVTIDGQVRTALRLAVGDRHGTALPAPVPREDSSREPALTPATTPTQPDETSDVVTEA